MSVIKAVQFRYLAAQLTQIELNTFVTNFLQTQDNIILTLLFEHFSKSSMDPDEVDNINKSISDIIQSRKQKPKRISSPKFKLDHIPKSLIGHISSFLNQNDHINLSKTNRFVHIGCNVPNLLQTLDLQKIKGYNYSSIRWNQYTSITNLEISMNAISHLPQFRAPNFNHVHKLTLNGQKQHGFIDSFLSKNIINPHNITTLRCKQFGSINPSDDMLKDEFLRLLTKCTNIEYMYLYELSVTDDITATEIADLCPNIIGLKVTGGCRVLNNNLIGNIGNKLKYLSINQIRYDAFNFEDVDFNKIEQFKTTRPSNEAFAAILKTATNLKKLYVHFTRKDMTFMTNDEIKNVITNLIIKCELLEYLQFMASSSDFYSILDGIECGLIETKQRNRSKIKIMIRMNESLNAKAVTNNIGKIIYLLETSKIRNFMLIWKIRNDLNINDVNEIKNDLLAIILGINVMHYKSCFVITNQHCSINGYTESWYME